MRSRSPKVTQLFVSMSHVNACCSALMADNLRTMGVRWEARPAVKVVLHAHCSGNTEKRSDAKLHSFSVLCRQAVAFVES